jgi:hypothetical protein
MKTLERPLLLMDVDGVLCPLGDRGREPLIDAGRFGHTYLRYGAATPQRLQQLGEAFRLVWATSWEHEANEVVGPLLGLPPLPVIVFDDDAGEGESWKLPAIKAFVGDRPFAYIDDDIGRDAEDWAARRHAPTLLLPIKGDRGLLAPDVEELLRFAADLEQSGEPHRQIDGNLRDRGSVTNSDDTQFTPPGTYWAATGLLAGPHPGCRSHPRRAPHSRLSDTDSLVDGRHPEEH